MSTSINAHIVWGFPVPGLSGKGSTQWRAEHLGWDGDKPLYLGEWLQKHHPQLEQHNAGRSNGGNPDYLVGTRPAATIEDAGRTLRAYTEISRAASIEWPGAELEGEVEAACEALGCDVDTIGLYLVVDLA